MSLTSRQNAIVHIHASITYLHSQQLVEQKFIVFRLGLLYNSHFPTNYSKNILEADLRYNLTLENDGHFPRQPINTVRLGIYIHIYIYIFSKIIWISSSSSCNILFLSLSRKIQPEDIYFKHSKIFHHLFYKVAQPFNFSMRPQLKQN